MQTVTADYKTLQIYYNTHVIIRICSVGHIYDKQPGLVHVPPPTPKSRLGPLTWNIIFQEGFVNVQLQLA